VMPKPSWSDRIAVLIVLAAVLEGIAMMIT
jgi:hypothetical protein